MDSDDFIFAENIDSGENGETTFKDDAFKVKGETRVEDDISYSMMLLYSGENDIMMNATLSIKHTGQVLKELDSVPKYHINEPS